MAHRRSDMLRVLTVVATIPLAACGWYWADGTGGSAGTLRVIGAAMIVLAFATVGWCVSGHRLRVAALLLLGGWSCGIVGLGLAVSSLE